MEEHVKKVTLGLVMLLIAAPMLAQKGGNAGAGERKAAIAGGAPVYWAQRPVTNFLKAKPGEPVRGDFIVVFKDHVASRSSGPQIARRVGARVGAVWTRALNGILLKGVSERALYKLSRDARVKYIEEDGIVEMSATQNNPPSWGLDRVDQRALPLSGSYTYNVDGTGVHAYIIDTGVHDTHVDFGGRATQEVNFAGGVNDDCNGHGTHVSGTVGSSTYGIAKNVTIHGVKVLDCNGSGTNSGVISGIDWVTANHISPAVANMSLGGGASTSIDNAVNNSVASGVFYAVAAGNESTDACTKSPARAADAYTVGSTTSTDGMSSFSNFGTCVDIFAPGSSITSTWNTSNTATNTISGTSMATPHVTGSAALVFDAHPAWTPAQVKTELTDTATCGVISGIPSGPNLLLYTLGGSDPNCGAPPPPPPPPGNCPAGFVNQFTGTLSSGSADLVTPDCNASGTFNGLLLCDAGAADLDLFLDLFGCSWWSCSFSPFASSTSSGCNEQINTSGSSGTYRWRVQHFSGPTESFLLCTNQC